jgi:heme-degrading monooxygenase HmoA
VILEVAVLTIKEGMENDFEKAFAVAQSIIASMRGYIAHQLQRCCENPRQYILLVNWETVDAHTVGFRGSQEYRRWKELLHHFYDPFPTVEHYREVTF